VAEEALMSRSRYLAIALVILLVGGTLRTLWLRADPPTTSVGIVWHDEGPWTHNARNRALWGVWRTDSWNPVFIAPVFTALEYGAFEAFGVGTWQARTVPVASGLVALVLLMAGLSALAGRRVAIMGGVLLATEYTWVMWNRAALMESTMTAFIVAAWAAYAIAARRPAWGFVAGVAAVLAWFTKAAAAFFVAAIVLEAIVTFASARWAPVRGRLGLAAPSAQESRAAWLTIVGLAAAGGAIAVAFVWPHWTEYWFYNVQMSVERKPSYDIRSLIDRATWIGVAQDIFTRMWPLLAAAALAIAGVFARWRDARPAERLLVLWVLLGLLELTVHDSGTERRYVMFVPAIVALASLWLGSGAAWLSPRAAVAPWSSRLLSLPILLALAYVAIGSALRPLLNAPGALQPYALTVRVSAALAVLAGLALLLWWSAVVRWCSARPVPPGAATVLVGLVVVWNLGQYARWISHRGELNYRASIALGQLLPSGTLVQGKLANGLALENRIKPVFVGRGFGNYADRFDRDDVRYILTYDLPWIGYESQPGLIQEILDRYPNRERIATFDVDETPNRDRAVLIDKHPGVPGAAGPNRARD
jgi:hypothetical protein